MLDLIQHRIHVGYMSPPKTNMRMDEVIQPLVIPQRDVELPCPLGNSQ